MNNIENIKKAIRDIKPILSEKHKINEIGIFGSYARGEQNPNSDIDIIINFDEFPGLIEFIGIENILSEFLETQVDLVTKSGLKPEIRKDVFRETIYL